MLKLLPTTLEEPPATITETYSLSRPIEAGEFVYVYDGHKDDYIWQLVSEVRVEYGRQKIRVEGTVFFFDEALVAAVRRCESVD
jgi:hypothetical protein